MSDWAIVIGIDRYWRDDACLSGAVRDARKVAAWLLDPKGGNVPRSNLRLLASPLEGKRRPPGAADATKDNMIKAIVDVVDRSGARGDRLYFYYAGHGLTARDNFTYEPAIVATDFDDALQDKTFALRSLWEFFEATEFRDQFFFIDACRTHWPAELIVGRWPAPRTRTPGQDQVQQFRLHATSPGLAAVEHATPGREEGAFTSALLDALEGKGSAKAWSPADADYRVRWANATAYVIDQFKQRALPAGAGFQVPQATGIQGVIDRDLNPVLARIDPASVRSEQLRVHLRPEDVLRSVTLEIVDRDAGAVVATRARVRRLPVTFRLPPRSYIVRALAPDYEPAIAQPPIELYSPTKRELELRPAVGRPRVRAAAAQPSTRARAVLTVVAPDRLAIVEIADPTGKVLAAGEGLVRKRLAPGLYRAVLRTPEGAVAERAVELAGADVTIDDLAVPDGARSPAVERVVRASALEMNVDGTMEVSELTGPVASTQLSTILSLAATFQALREPEYGRRLRTLGLDLFETGIPRDAPGGVYVVFGTEARTRAAATRTVERARLRVWPFGDDVPDEQAELRPAATSGIGEFAKPLAPGQYWLSLELPRTRPLVFVLAVLPRRAAILVVQQSADRTLSAYEFLPTIAPDPSLDADSIRRVELIQRVYAGGRLDLAHETAAQLLRSKKIDPLAGALGGYLFLRSGHVGQLEVAATNMRRWYPELSDSHVLRAELEASRGNHRAAAAATSDAVAAGVPLFAEGLSHLLDALEEYRINHDNARLLSHIFEHRDRASLWTVWKPEKLTAGRLLVP